MYSLRLAYTFRRGSFRRYSGQQAVAGAPTTAVTLPSASSHDFRDTRMARLPRLVLAGQPHLVIQAARAGQVAFLDDEDRRNYLGALLESSRACAVTVHAYALLDERVSLLVTPAAADSLGRFMQRVGRRYVGAFNRRHGYSGTLWDGRYRTAVLDPQRHVLMSMRLIEQSPLRRGLVEQPADWRWSSAAYHVGRSKDPLVREHEAYWRLGNTPFAREAAYATQLAAELSEAEVARLEVALRRGWPGEPVALRERIEKAAPTRVLEPKPRGRPRRAA